MNPKIDISSQLCYLQLNCNKWVQAIVYCVRIVREDQHYK